MLQVQSDLRSFACKDYSKKCKRFFKTAPGEYGHGDQFLGVKTPAIRKLAKEYVSLSFTKCRKLINSKYHEERLCGLIILVNKYSLAKEEANQEKIYQEYIKSFKYINNWDLVDVTCPHVVGKHLFNKDRSILYEWIKSEDLWTRRIGMLANWWFVRKGDLSDVFKMSKALIADEHDLIHKAVGWMLREAGKKDIELLEKYLNKNYKKMPRTMLRYSIEKFPSAKRQKYLKGEV